MSSSASVRREEARVLDTSDLQYWTGKLLLMQPKDCRCLKTMQSFCATAGPIS